MKVTLLLDFEKLLHDGENAKAQLEELGFLNQSYHAFENGTSEIQAKSTISLLPDVLSPVNGPSINMANYLNDKDGLDKLSKELKEYCEQTDKMIQSALAMRSAAEISLRCVEAAKQYHEWKPPAFKRTWKETKTSDDGASYSRSNAVYQSFIALFKPSDHWTVMETVVIRDVRPCATKPWAPYERAQQDNPKHFDRRTNAFEYVMSLMEKHDKEFFYEDYPPVPSSYKKYFMWAGKLLPEYKLGE